MKSFASSALSRWSVRLAAFGFVAAVAAYAAGEPRRPAPSSAARPVTAAQAPAAPTMTSGKIPTITTDSRLASLEKRAAADAKRLHFLEVSVKNLEYAVAHLPKPPPSTAPFCKEFAVSANPQGGTSNCFPYHCDGSTGVCLRGSCSSVDDCDVGQVCNASSRCGAPSTVQSSGDD